MRDQFWAALVMAMGPEGFCRACRIMRIAREEMTLDDKLVKLDEEGVLEDADLPLLSLLLEVPEIDISRTHWWQTYRNTN